MPAPFPQLPFPPRIRTPYGGGLGGLRASAGLGAFDLRLRPFHGSPDTLEQMRQNAWGARGEKSARVRMLTEQVVRDVQAKDYLGEILAIRNFCTPRIRYTNDPLHVEWVRDPEALAERIETAGVVLADCEEIAQMIATMALTLGRKAEYVVVGFGERGRFSHVFTRVQEPKTNQWILTDPVAGTDERSMADRVTTWQIWSLDEWNPPTILH